MKPTGGQLKFSWQGRGLLHGPGKRFESAVKRFKEFGEVSRSHKTSFSLPEVSKGEVAVPVYVNEFWTAQQRKSNPLHEISYRACFKAQLPRFFIERLTVKGDVVYDPFMGRGTTLLEAGLMGRVPYGCDVSPLCSRLVEPRLVIPSLSEITTRLSELNLRTEKSVPEELLTFYHKETLEEICSLKRYFLERECSGKLDAVDKWIRMVAINRLTGHSPGFFSVYSLPPNQAVSVQSQRKINEKRQQIPPKRDISALILRKSKRLLGKTTDEFRAAIQEVGERALLLSRMAHDTPEIPSGSVSLVVTSPPFLDVVDYATDNWLRCWFLGIDAKTVKMTVPRKLEQWEASMTRVFLELFRVLRPGGFVAFEVGEVRGGMIKLESAVLRCGFRAGLEPGLVMINDQAFTKTANCWGVDNNAKGTNTNRIVVFSKPE